ncbi:oligoribonuclease [Euwallacea similis]|uniref:oligoribonuclease n=1 Tax=Euwallacea similis TaxID=1736056 RepID=UPI00344C2D76
MLRKMVTNFFSLLGKKSNTNQFSVLSRNGVCKYFGSKIIDVEDDRIVWIDLEMTGLNVDQDKIMEIACLITDCNLNIIAESSDIVINQSKETLNGMDKWCTNQHGKTGLTEACLNSKISLEEAEIKILNFLKEHVSPKSSPLAGNSVYMDRFFLIKHMPQLNDYLHYRIVDVSTIKELCKRWNKAAYERIPKKEFTHRALNDIKESVNELKYYQEQFFNIH